MENITTHIKLLVQIVRCIHLKRELSEIDPNPQLNFWRLMHGGLLDLAVLEWTKIFGSNAEPTHWKGVVDDQKAFREDLFSRTGITENEWSKYWNEMKRYRDAAVAHHFDNPNFTYYPKLEIALTSCYFYYAYLIAKARELGETRYPDNLEEYCNRFAKQTNAVAKLALDATADCKEEVC